MLPLQFFHLYCQTSGNTLALDNVLEVLLHTKMFLGEGDTNNLQNNER